MSTTPLPTVGDIGRPTGRHPVNIGHLVMGIAFLGIVGVWALIQADVVDGADIRWLLPVPWVLAGGAGLTAVAVSGSRRRTTRQVGWVPPADPADEPTDEPTDDTEELR
jgi:hypothetical protein